MTFCVVLAGCGGNGSSSLSGDQQKHVTPSDKTQTSAHASDYQPVVEALYISYFGRPADPGGLANFENALLAANAPTDIQAFTNAYASSPAIQSLVNSFGTSKESQGLYGSGNSSAFVTAVFLNVLGRQPQAAGLAYWSGAINSGSLSQGDAALAIMSGALANTTPAGLLDAALIKNRIAVAGYFSNELSVMNATPLYSGQVAAANARNMLTGVSATTDSVAFEPTVNAFITAIANVPSFGGIAFATGTDTSSITLAWVAAQDSATPAAQIIYKVYQSTAATFVPSSATLVQSVVGNTQTVLTGLAAGTTYYIKVVAVNQKGILSAAGSASASALSSPIVLSTTTPLVNASDLKVSAPTVSGSTYTFPATSSSTMPAVGSVLVGIDASGNSYLVNVLSASNSGGSIVLQTSPAMLSKAVPQGEINTTSVLFASPVGATTAAAGPADVNGAGNNMVQRMEWKNHLLKFEESAPTNLPAGISVKRNAANGHYMISINPNDTGRGPSIRQKSSASTGTSADPFSYDVAVSFTPALTTDAKWNVGLASGFNLESANLVASGTLSLDANATYNFQTSGSYTKDVTFPMFTRTYTADYLAGGVPVHQTITFTLAAKLQANATASVKATANANYTQGVTFGVQYDPANGWQPIAPSTTESESLTANLNVNGGVSSTLTLIPTVEVKFYSILAGNLSIQPSITGNIQAAAVANANFLTGYFPPGITQLTVFDASLNVACYAGADLTFLSSTVTLLNPTQICSLPSVNLFSLPKVALALATQTDGSSLLTTTVTDGTNDHFDNSSIEWTMYPSTAGTLTPSTGNPMQASFKMNPTNAAATIFFSGYGSLGPLGRQFAQTNVVNYAGTYTGSYSGGDSGTFQIVVAASGAVTGSAYSNGSGKTTTLTGAVQDGGIIKADAGGGETAGGATFNLTINPNGSLTGTWSHPSAKLSGNGIGQKIN